MKKKLNGRYSPRAGISKILLRMKLITIFLLVAFAATSANSYSQGTKFNLRLNDVTVKDVFQQIEENSEFILLYNEKSIDLNRKVNVRVKGETIESVLEQVFKGTGNNWNVYDRQIVVLAANETETSAGIKLHVESVLQQPQRRDITGTVRDNRGQPIPGVAVIVKGTTIGAVTGNNGNFQLSIPPDAQVLEFSFVGMKRQEVTATGRTLFEVVLEEETFGVDEVIVVGYGTQKRSDITGTVASLGKERLEMVPNLNIAQAIQGSIPGIMVQQTAAGAKPDQAILIRGRNSITADNTPLIVVDGIPYSGAIHDINPLDILSVEILKDASAAAIYGSRGANGVILVTTKGGLVGRPLIQYEGFYSTQRMVNVPNLLDGEQFYDFKMTRFPAGMTASEREVYESGEWVDWMDLTTRNGVSQQHSLSVSGGTNMFKYFISGTLLDVQGLMLNDYYKRHTGRINLELNANDWLTIGTRTQYVFDDTVGEHATVTGFEGIYKVNPLVRPFNTDGSHSVQMWPEFPSESNPLQPLDYINIDESHQIISNNFARVDFPFLPGLTYRLNTGVRVRFADFARYRGRNTSDGFATRGNSTTRRSRADNTTIENILSYNKEFGLHNVFLTALYSYEKFQSSRQSIDASDFPNDLLSWYAASQASFSTPGYSFDETALLSQMIRINYSYDSRYLGTLTGRRDGFSGFGSHSKWGIFPSIALGWNLANEDFFPFKDFFNELKLRISYGFNGNQAVGSYGSIARLRELNMISNRQTAPGFIPSTLAQEDLGWESSRTLNTGVDIGIMQNRFTGYINYYKTRTKDLLLKRSISGVHGITSIIQNIGKTENTGIELTVNSRNIVTPNFRWFTSFNFAYGRNRIVSLYGELDEFGIEKDDVANRWFIGHPVRVVYGFIWDGVWQMHEADEAARYGSQPGFIKIRDVNSDGILNVEDQQIIGQQDPKTLFGISNSFSYKNFNLEIFLHGVGGVTRVNDLLTDDAYAEVRKNVTVKNWWTPENPTNEWIANHLNAHWMGGVVFHRENSVTFENASFIRLKDVTLSYNIPNNLTERAGLSRLTLFVTGRNLLTFTRFGGLDPELSGTGIPLQREFVVGVNLGF
jgi:TonB-linked SusC/RagA family outer membrane protein